LRRTRPCPTGLLLGQPDVVVMRSKRNLRAGEQVGGLQRAQEWQAEIDVHAPNLSDLDAHFKTDW